jgi:hypothetical protein
MHFALPGTGTVPTNIGSIRAAISKALEIAIWRWY